MNKHIIITGFVIAGGGLINMWLGTASKTTNTGRIIVGGFIVVFLLSILDMFGGPFDKIASALAMLTMVYVLLNMYVPIFQKLTSIGNTPTPAAGGGSSGAG